MLISEESADFGLTESGKGYADAEDSRGFEVTHKRQRQAVSFHISRTKLMYVIFGSYCRVSLL
jgi:hypothetical protein